LKGGEPEEEDIDMISEANSLNAINMGLQSTNPAKKLGKILIIDHHFALD
jgi:hypothetical protein